MGTRHPVEGQPNTATTVKPFETVASISKSNGSSYRYVLCPFCSAEVRVRESSLRSAGKRCGCGAVFRGTVARLTTRDLDADQTTPAAEVARG